MNDNGIKIEGINIWGSPVTPWLYDGAFNRTRGSNIDKHWKLIPSETDILITHGPAYGILDKNRVNYPAGCKSLKNVLQKIRPKVHICGHIHEGYGQKVIETTTYINACILDQNDCIKNPPILFSYS